MSSIVWNGERGRIVLNGDAMTLPMKPALGFSFATIEATDEVGTLTNAAGVARALTAEELELVVSFFAGNSAPNHVEKVWGVDEDGNPLGLVDPGDAFAVVGPAPPGTWRWNFATGSWSRVVSLEDVVDEAYTLIDKEAGAARVRYITDVPGQQAVYLRKYEQALQYRDAGYIGDVPVYIAAEAAANGGTAQEAADTIITIADLWDNQISPAIEQTRIAGKRAVQAAADIPAVIAARDEAIDLLRGL